MAGAGGIDPATLGGLHQWIDRYRGRIALAISENYSDDIVCGRMDGEEGLRAYAHIDANGFLKRSSYDNKGVLIGPDGVMKALLRLENWPAEGQQP